MFGGSCIRRNVRSTEQIAMSNFRKKNENKNTNTGPDINSCTLFLKQRRSYKMRLKCVNDGLVRTKLSNFYLLFYKRFRNFEF